MPNSTPAPRIALINDTSLYVTHFGCRLVCQTFREQFARTGLELTMSLPRDFSIAEYAGRLATMDLLVINGEGSIHHDRHRHLLELADRFPSVLVNCVYQENTGHGQLGKFLYLSARESLSAAEIRRHAPCEVTPDVMFAASLLRSYQKPEPGPATGCTDSVIRQYARWGPWRIPRKIDCSPNSPTIAAYLAYLCRHRNLAIGRFHAAVACSVLEIPFATWDSNTWKTRGMMSDMGVPELHFTTREEAIRGVPTEFPGAVREFSREALVRVRRMFDRIAEIARARAGG